jgi:hypothetical protein
VKNSKKFFSRFGNILFPLQTNHTRIIDIITTNSSAAFAAQNDVIVPTTTTTLAPTTELLQQQFIYVPVVVSIF